MYMCIIDLCMYMRIIHLMDPIGLNYFKFGTILKLLFRDFFLALCITVCILFPVVLMTFVYNSN